jgi:nicotinate-nucleotide adenylyltransferase
VNVGILGGTFDPVHLGHLIMAEHAREHLGLDHVLFIPAGQPWRKSDRIVTPAVDRLAMLELAIAGNDSFGISDIELRREGPTYTADTLEALGGERLDDSFYFIVGADALADLPHWHDPRRIVQHAVLAVTPRDGDDLPLHALRDAGIADARVEAFPMPRTDVSSTEIRARVAAGRSVRYLVPDCVAAYIRERRLYTPEK